MTPTNINRAGNEVKEFGLSGRLPKFALLLFVPFALNALAVAAIAQIRPNVLFISIDDLNDWEGAMEGNPQVKTP